MVRVVSLPEWAILLRKGRRDLRNLRPGRHLSSRIAPQEVRPPCHSGSSETGCSRKRYLGISFAKRWLPVALPLCDISRLTRDCRDPGRSGIRSPCSVDCCPYLLRRLPPWSNPRTRQEGEELKRLLGNSGNREPSISHLASGLDPQVSPVVSVPKYVESGDPSRGAVIAHPVVGDSHGAA